MRKVVFGLFLGASFLFACGGTCIECHPKLVPIINDNEHKILNQCATCHDKPVVHGTACGQDCFECHSKEKLYSDATVKEHQAVKACYSCHKEPQTAQISTKRDISVPTKRKTLIDVLK